MARRTSRAATAPIALDAPVDRLKGVGPAAAAALAARGLATVEDLLWLVPRRYDDALQMLARRDQDRRSMPGRPPGGLVYRIVCLDEDASGLTEHDREGLCHALD